MILVFLKVMILLLNMYIKMKKSFRVKEEDSLYYGHVRDDFTYPEIEFCTCSQDDDKPGLYSKQNE